MRILTGKHRIAYEAAIVLAAHGAEARRQYEQRITALDIAYKKALVDLGRERQRSDNAVDALLAMRGVPPITPQLDIPPVTFDNPLAEDQAEVDRIEADMKRLGVGAVFAQEAKG